MLRGIGVSWCCLLRELFLFILVGFEGVLRFFGFRENVLDFGGFFWEV